MNIYEEIRSLSRISENFRKNKKPKSKWPVEFQLRVLSLIEVGLSPQVLSKKLNIPVQTYYHWRRVWKNRPKTSNNFLEVPTSDKLKSQLVNEKEVVPVLSQNTGATSAVIIFPNGTRIENISDEFILKVLAHAV